MDDGSLRAALTRHWGPTGEIVDHHGGMNSATWFTSLDGARVVAKAVPARDAAWFEGGLQVAAALGERGFAAGAPVPAADGRLGVPVDGTVLAVLRWVPGEPATDQRAIGRTLAEVHELLRDVTGPPLQRLQPFHWVDPAAAHLAARPWLRDAVAAAVAGLGTGYTEGLLHTDPAPEAFVGNGLIDWSVALRGPLLYDVASAVMYLGGPAGARPFLDAYLAAGRLTPDELHAGLPALIRFRWAVQADYFARRITTGDLTGITGDADNLAGLADAEAGLRAFLPPHR